MKTPALFLLALASSFLSAHARLGETPAEIAARYGQQKDAERPKDKRMQIGRYESRGFTILVAFLDGKSQGEVFTKPADEAWLDSEIAAILKANSFGSEWTKVDGISVDKHWKLGESAVANFKLGIPPALSLFTKQMMDYLSKQNDERLKGL